jgi:hypothetical protein
MEKVLGQLIERAPLAIIVIDLTTLINVNVIFLGFLRRLNQIGEAA